MATSRRLALTVTLALAAALGGCANGYVPSEPASDEAAWGALEPAEDRVARLEAEAAAAEAALQAEREQALADYLAAHADRPAEVRTALEEGRIAFGMTQEEVALVLFADVAKTATSTAEGVTTAWEVTDGPETGIDGAVGAITTLHFVDDALVKVVTQG